MLDKNTLIELKNQLPHRYVKPIQEAYSKLYEEEISRWTVMRFFEGEAFSEKLHSAVLSVASNQQKLIAMTLEVINA